MSMPKPDVALKNFFKDNEIFAAVFNSFVFNNRVIINPDDIREIDSTSSETVYVKSETSKHKRKKINRYRDIIRETTVGSLVILGIENQSNIHYSMPVRKLLYDALTYSSEIGLKYTGKNRTAWTVDERLSSATKGTKIHPVITIIFYTGEDPWDGPQNLHDMLDMDERIKPYVPDYPLYVLDLGHDDTLKFENETLEELRVALSAVYSETATTETKEISSSILALTGILSGVETLYNNANSPNENGGKQQMCKAWQNMMDKATAEVREELESKNKEIESKDKEIESKDKEIIFLRQQIAALQQGRC